MFRIKTPFGIIVEMTDTAIVFIGDKYFFNQGAKPVCVYSNVSYPSSSKWVEKKTHEKKYSGGCGELTAMVTVTKGHLY